MPKPTNQDLLERHIRLEEAVTNMDKALRSEIGTVGASILELKKIVKDLELKERDRETIARYKKNVFSRENTKVWVDVGKQIIYVLGLIGTILYAYISTRGIQ